MRNQNNNPINKSKGKSTKESDRKRIEQELKDRPMTRRMLATYIGYTDQTFMVTQAVRDLIKLGNAQVIGKMKCERSNHLAQVVTTDPHLFNNICSNQLSLFDNEGE